MLRGFLSLLVLLFVTNTAQAFDDRRPYSWTGLYVGAHAGWAKADWSGDFFYQDVDLKHGYSFDTNGWLGGLQAGGNVQMGRWVFGVEGDIAWGDLKDHGQFQANDADPSTQYLN